ncbi:MAG: excinuclease ABC subunit UvrC [Oscillospiraceae bacterium]|nr:excinuclease ABC subunit UvrC [Oscillospiraceae bacterium]
MVDLREKARSLPLKPGVYLMLDKNGGVLYVGKAKALKSRVSSYFQENAGHTAKTRRMVSRVADFDTIIAQSEFEALVLECSLIRRHQPKYNILLKSGKGYPYIRLDMASPYPNFTVTYQISDSDGAEYFGPYGGRSLSLSVIQALKQTLKLPVCEKIFPRDIGKGRPCLESHLNRCVAVCTGNVPQQEYRKIIAQAVLLLEGKAQKLISAMQEEMQTASDELLFEKAAALRDKIAAISALSRRQIVVGGGMADTDVLGCYAGEAKSGVAVIHYIQGNLISRDIEIFDDAGDGEDVLAAFMAQYYPARRRAPKTILVSHPVEGDADIAALIHEKTGTRPAIICPKRGEKKALVSLALANIREEVERVTTREERIRKLLTELQRLLGLDAPPRRIEAVDISNTGDSERVGAMTCFVDGKPLKRAYRHFIIHDESIHDDYHSMQDVLTRRLKRALSQSAGFEELPDILLVDGGATHAAMAARVMDEQGIHIPVFGMVKDDRHRTRALVRTDGSEVGLTAFPAGFAFIGQIQEETHRTAIDFHHKRRSRFSSSLDNIPGVGEARRQALVGHFKSVKAISRATVEELRQAVPAGVAEMVYRHFHQLTTDNSGYE